MIPVIRTLDVRADRLTLNCLWRLGQLDTGLEVKWSEAKNSIEQASF